MAKKKKSGKKSGNNKNKKGKKKFKKLSLSFVPYSDIAKLKSSERIKKLLDIVLDNRIVILQGRLEPTEETSMIQSTMALVDRVDKFTGIELAVIQPNEQENMVEKFKSHVAKFLVGERDVLTIMGPASIVKEVKRDPSKIDLMLNDE